MVDKNHSQSDKKVINIKCACGNDGLANELVVFTLPEQNTYGIANPAVACVI